MSSGIIVPALLEIQGSISQAIIISSSQANKNFGVQARSSGPWMPPQWAQPALTVMTVVNTGSAATGQPATAAARQAATTNYVFQNPSVIRASHRRTTKATSHPVLTGANIADHAYIEPSSLTLEIIASDAMASLQNGAWVGWPTAGITAWQILKSLQLSRTLLTITTRLDTYTNMLIMECEAPDENKTRHGLRATVVFREIIAASVASQSAVSARPQASSQNPQGIVQGSAADPSQVSQHVIPSASYPNIILDPSVPGAGNVSSNSLGQLPTH